jgi:hypothetical protein
LNFFQNRRAYDYIQSQASSEASNPSAAPEAPGAWNANPSPPKQTWTEWLFGTSRSTPKPIYKFDYERYVLVQSSKPKKNPGVSAKDIVEFLKALPQSERAGQPVILHFPSGIIRYRYLCTGLFLGVPRFLSLSRF